LEELEVRRRTDRESLLQAAARRREWKVFG